MDDLKVLMLGPGEPTAMNSGLGIAVWHIAKHLQSRVHLTIIQPGNNPETENLGDRGYTVENVDIDRFDDLSVMKDIARISIKTKISPYFYSSIEEEEDHGEEKASEVKKAFHDFSEKIIKEAKKIEFDLIYAHDWTTLEAGRKIKEISSKPLVVHIHSLDYDRSCSLSNSWVFQLEKENLAKADWIIAVSNYTAGILQEHYDIDKNKISISHNAISKNLSSKVGKVFPEKLILFVGRLTGQKGPGLFMQIAAKVHEKEPNTRFVMAGNGELLKELIESGAYRSVSGKFHFTGRIDREQMSELYAMSDIYCMPSVSEPFGLSALEAASFEIPVVLSRQSGAAEVLPGALKADYWDIDKFVGHILDLLKDEKQYKKVITENNGALAALTWENTAARVFKAFERVTD